ncbi:LOW QUALITY PROTEIN: membrane metallo-endopeptidase-like 1 protein [Plakobranchus ocellatus]|uniref:Membrane metallo-endopeptidase-like 1 protein n=1 Tax=Plakobranchus ocellatus TaxID=259542 RepID=A0AAV4CYB6_9GAST|nr:LOW QUALITY PROTEIN: membrane metallo-endopeptidase-like 1 protein [Plakobranchus ocellatus]
MLRLSSSVTIFKLWTLILLNAELAAVEDGFKSYKSAFKRSGSACQNCCDSICLTPDCVKAATILEQYVDPEVDPCTDFAEFACGNYFRPKKHPSQLEIQKKDNYNILKGIFHEKSKPGDPAYLKNMRNLYKSCMDERIVEEIGVGPYLQTPYAKEWPTLMGRNWSAESNFDLNAVITRYAGVNVLPIFSLGVINIPVNPATSAIHLSGPPSEFQRRYTLHLRNDPEVVAYETYLRDVAIELGADPAVAAQDATGVVDLEFRMTKIFVDATKKKGVNSIFPTTLKKLGKHLSSLDIPGAARALFAIGNVTLDDDQQVVIDQLAYFLEVEHLVFKFDKRTLQNIFGFNFALPKVTDLTRKLKKIRNQYLKATLPNYKETSLNEYCLTGIVNFPLGMSKEYVDRQFTEDAKIHAKSMVDSIRASFKELKREAFWMINKTWADILEKPPPRGDMIGFPDHSLSKDEIDETYVNLRMRPDKLYRNRETLSMTHRIKSLQSLKQPWSRRDSEQIPLYEPVASYNPDQNEIVLTASIFQPPLFSITYPDYINYGAIGALVVDEIVRAIAAEEKNRFRENEEDHKKKLKVKLQVDCLMDQYTKANGDSSNEPEGFHVLLSEIIHSGLKENYSPASVEHNGVSASASPASIEHKQPRQVPEVPVQHQSSTTEPRQVPVQHQSSTRSLGKCQSSMSRAQQSPDKYQSSISRAQAASASASPASVEHNGASASASPASVEHNGASASASPA